MATIVINEKELRESVNKYLSMDEDLIVEQEIVNEKIDAMLVRLAENPIEVITETILEDIYIEIEDAEEDGDDE